MFVATYTCSNCKVSVPDRGEAGAKFAPSLKCPRCGAAMPLVRTEEVADPPKEG